MCAYEFWNLAVGLQQNNNSSQFRLLYCDLSDIRLF